jgi:hypothetical protein
MKGTMMNTTLETLKTYRNVDDLASAAVVEAVPTKVWATGYTWTIRMPVAQGLAPKPHPAERHATKKAAVAAGRTMLALNLSGAQIGIPGPAVDTRRTIKLTEFLEAESIDVAYEIAD